MKKLAFVLFVSVLSISTVFAQDTAEGPVFEFESETIDYGKIEKGADGKRIFKFKNVGNAPLFIKNIKSSCGCTVPKASKEPIMPGQSSEIAVTYDTKRIGGFSKVITITSNANESSKRIKIKGIVLKPNTTSVVEKKKNLLSSAS